MEFPFFSRACSSNRNSDKISPKLNCVLSSSPKPVKFRHGSLSSKLSLLQTPFFFSNSNPKSTHKPIILLSPPPFHQSSPPLSRPQGRRRHFPHKERRNRRNSQAAARKLLSIGRNQVQGLHRQAISRTPSISPRNLETHRRQKHARSQSD